MANAGPTMQVSAPLMLKAPGTLRGALIAQGQRLVSRPHAVAPRGVEDAPETVRGSAASGVRQRSPATLDAVRTAQRDLIHADMRADEVIRLEASWKDRLGTREFGLNKN
jgi:hypothetical protein